MKNSKRGVEHFMMSFKYSMLGLKVALGETAVRQELMLGIVHFIALWCLDVGWLVGMVLTAFWLLVLIVEILNTSIESVVDLVSPGLNALAGRAKDLGSAAVFLSLVLFFTGWAIAILRLFD